MRIGIARVIGGLIKDLDRYTTLASKLGSFDKDRALKEVLSEMAAVEIRAAVEAYLEESINDTRMELEDYGVDVEA